MSEYGLGLGDGRLIDAIHANDHWLGTWVNYTPIVTSNLGDPTSYTATGKYLPKGKLIFLAVNVNIVTAGLATGATALYVTLPFQNIDRNTMSSVDFTKVISWNFAGHAVGTGAFVTLYTLTGYTSIQSSINQLVVIKYDSTGFVADTNVYLLSGFYGIT